jgi:hypothetical protein
LYQGVVEIFAGKIAAPEVAASGLHIQQAKRPCKYHSHAIAVEMIGGHMVEQVHNESECTLGFFFNSASFYGSEKCF